MELEACCQPRTSQALTRTQSDKFVFSRIVRILLGFACLLFYIDTARTVGHAAKAEIETHNLPWTEICLGHVFLFSCHADQQLYFRIQESFVWDDIVGTVLELV